MEQIYIRKLHPHDITHEVSVTQGIVRNFFNSQMYRIPFFREDGIVRYFVDINNATDPRFGRDFKRMYISEKVDAGDFLLCLKRSEGFYLYVLKKEDADYSWISSVFDSRRHLIVCIPNDILDLRRDNFFSVLKVGIANPISIHKDGMF